MDADGTPGLARSQRDQESDTEDEEVKLNCIGGVRGCQDSDFNTSDSSEEEKESSEDSEDYPSAESCQGVVNFVNRHDQQPPTGLLLHRPKPVLSAPMMSLSIHSNEHEKGSKLSSVLSSSITGGLVSFSIEAKPMPIRKFHPEGHSEKNVGMRSEVGSLQDCSALHQVAARVMDIGGHDRFSKERVDPDFVDLVGLPKRGRSQSDLTGLVAPLPDQKEQELDSKPITPSQNRQLDDGDKQRFKRVHSSNNIDSLDIAVSPKRMRRTLNLNSLSLLPTVLQFAAETRSVVENIKGDALSGCEVYDDELDKRLSEELDQENEESSSCEISPVPLLTPPQSPLTLQVEEETVTVCEWPSNLAVDSAMSAVINLRPMSPNSLQQFEQDEELRVASQPELTPLARGIYVGFN